MTKPKNPLFGFDARGTLAKVLTFRKRGQQTIAETTPFPKDAKTSAQLSWRVMYQACADLWHTLTAAEKATWESLARRQHMTGYAYYMSQCLRPNPGIYLPLAGGTMSGDIAMASHKITGLPAPTLNPDAATKAYVDAATPTPDYPMKLNPAITRWVLPGWYAASVVAATATAGRIYYTPIFVSQTTTYIRLGCNVIMTAAGTADLRIFNWNNGLPGSLILSAGTVNTGTSGRKEITISQQLTRGYYFLAIRCTAAPTINGLDSARAISPPIPGIATGNDINANYLILIADAPYADPAPAPTGIETPSRAFVTLREN